VPADERRRRAPKGRKERTLSAIDRLTDALAQEEAGKRRLAALSFLEATILPIPLETVIAPLMAAHPKRAYSIAAAIFAGCLAGALVFYLLALALYDPVVAPALDGLGLLDDFDAMRARLNDESLFWTVFLVSLTPAPFQLATLGAGAVGGSVLTFMLAVAASRALRYFGLGFLARRFGPRLLEAAGGRTQLVVKGVVALVAVYVVASLPPPSGG
jgi:membrane protein YqaA with SNARE-associated domain